MPFDDPYMRASDPNWYWRDPLFDLVLSVVETLQVANVQRGNPSGASRSKFPERVKRPWDNKGGTKKIGGKVKLPMQKVLDWIESRREKG